MVLVIVTYVIKFLIDGEVDYENFNVSMSWFMKEKGKDKFESYMVKNILWSKEWYRVETIFDDKEEVQKELKKMKTERVKLYKHGEVDR